MLILNYVGEKTKYKVDFDIVTSHIVNIIGKLPAKTKGFTLSREGKKDNWDYAAYTTVYRELEGAIQFSNDGSVYVPPEPIPEPKPYIPTLAEVQEMKEEEMNTAQQAAIRQGVDVQLTDGRVEHFALSEKDQTYLMGLQSMVAKGESQIPWHNSDTTQSCKYYSNADMALISETALRYIMYHVTYEIDLSRYIRALKTKEEVEAVTYGMPIPEEYQGQVLKDMIAQMAQTEVSA